MPVNQRKCEGVWAKGQGYTPKKYNLKQNKGFLKEKQIVRTLKSGMAKSNDLKEKRFTYLV